MRGTNAAAILGLITGTAVVVIYRYLGIEIIAVMLLVIAILFLGLTGGRGR